MPNLSIKNVPVEVVAAMRERATANHRSLQGELLALVSQAAGNGFSAAVSSHARSIVKGHKSIEQIAAEHPQKTRSPVDRGRRSTDLIRKERDAR